MGKVEVGRGGGGGGYPGKKKINRHRKKWGGFAMGEF